MRLAVLSLLLWPRLGAAQDTTRVTGGDSVVVQFVNADLRAVVQALGRYLDRPLLVGNVPGVQVTFESPTPVPRGAIPGLLRGLAEAHGLALLADSAFYRITPMNESVRPFAGPPGMEGQGGAGPPELFTLRLKHARASDVAGTVGALFGIGSAGGARGLSGGTLSDELRRTAAPVEPVPGVPTPADGVGRDATIHGAVTLVPDELTNALLIRATRQDFEVIQAAVQQLDVRPLQVLIQVLIVEARKDRLFSLGVDATAEGISFDRGHATVQVTTQGGGLGDLVVRFMSLGRADVDAVLRAGATRGDVEILSRPALLATNNREARILVGSQRPFVQVSRSLPTDAPSRDQVIQYKDVGTRLIVRPTISADGYVTLDITQEVSTATNETAFDAPVISTREASTQVLVRDTQTIVLGGLIDRQRDVNSGGVPVLSDLPLLGGLFGRQSRRAADTELFLFLTPRVLRTDQEVEDATRRFEERRPR